ncbi:MAG: CBS domain-containing protein [Planctomycetes bacterium]|nr:CBS domain-containing protein [Planctomycetota bacterium]
MKTVRMALQRKGGKKVAVLGPDATAEEALHQMTQQHVGALVIHDGKRVAGILSERDILRKLVIQGRPLRDARVREIMTPNVLYVRPDQALDECMALMIDKHIRHLPVMEGSQLLGMLSIRDVVREVIAEQKFIIEQLEQYITG